MATEPNSGPAPDPARCYVLKPDELPALNYLSKGHPRPSALTWINRGTNQELRPTTVQMLMRTLFRETASPSVTRLHRSSGLRVTFGSASARDDFAKRFVQAQKVLVSRQRIELTAVFDNPSDAETGYHELVKAGVNPRAISLLWRAGQFLKDNHEQPPGHSKLSVAAASTGGGLAGAILGMTLLTLPGIGPIAVGGAIAASALSTIGAFGGALGASGAGIARMLSDIDVEDREVPYFVMQITTGKVFVSVDPAKCDVPREQVSAILKKCRGHFAPSAPG